MNDFWFIDRDVTQHRGQRIGASDIPALIPNPEKPTESLAGYERTALTVWEEKTGRRVPNIPGLPAEMGHYLEPKVVELFMRDIFGPELAAEWFLRRMQYEVLSGSGAQVRAADYQVPPVEHSIEFYTEDFIVHPDGIYRPESVPRLVDVVTAHGLSIDLSRPFYIEAKSARYWSARRPEGSMVSGYDFNLHTWQGIPLKHYVQIQFGLALTEIDIAYLPLLFDTSDFHVWDIRTDRKIQGQIIDLAARMAWHIKHDTPPKELAMNSSDIKRLYPELTTDFVYLQGDDAEKVREAAVAYNRAAKQEKLWAERKKEASDTLAVHLKDRKELRDENGPICRWTEVPSGEAVLALSEIKKTDPLAYRYLKRKGLLKETKSKKYPTVCGGRDGG